VHDAGLHDRGRPDLCYRVGQPGKPVADEDATVACAAVFDLGQHVQPIFGAFSALAYPQTEDVAFAIHRDRQHNIDRPVGDLPVADLDPDRVDEDDWVDRVQGTVLPLGHTFEHRISDRGDRLAGDLSPVDLRKMRGYFAGGQSLGGQRDDQVLDPGQPPLAFGDDLGFERRLAVSRACLLNPVELGRVRTGGVVDSGV
jgi:hypothetical protein